MGSRVWVNFVHFLIASPLLFIPLSSYKTKHIKQFSARAHHHCICALLLIAIAQRGVDLWAPNVRLLSSWLSRWHSLPWHCRSWWRTWWPQSSTGSTFTRSRASPAPFGRASLVSRPTGIPSSVTVTSGSGVSRRNMVTSCTLTLQERHTHTQQDLPFASAPMMPSSTRPRALRQSSTPRPTSKKPSTTRCTRATSTRPQPGTRRTRTSTPASAASSTMPSPTRPYAPPNRLSAPTSTAGVNC